MKSNADKLYSIKSVYPGIYLIKFKDDYNMAMHCLRYQEFYESPNSKFKGKSFTIFDYMEWYFKKVGCFTYPQDWAGFNFPAHIVKDVIEKGIPDKNKYDEEISNIYNYCRSLHSSDNFYMIFSLDGQTTKHEIAHGLFYLNKDYKKEMKKLVSELPSDAYGAIKQELKNLGYCSSVYVDECQAYFATGLTEEMKTALGITDNRMDSNFDYSKQFVRVFKKYAEKS